MLATTAPMLLTGIILLAAGILLAVLLTGAREVGLVTAVIGGILIIVHYIGV